VDGIALNPIDTLEKVGSPCSVLSIGGRQKTRVRRADRRSEDFQADSRDLHDAEIISFTSCPWRIEQPRFDAALARLRVDLTAATTERAGFGGGYASN
jgi:hypothetical protein